MRTVLALVGFLVFVSGVTSLENTEHALKTRLGRYRDTLQKYFLFPRHPISSEENWLYARTGVVDSISSSITDIQAARMVQMQFSTDVADPGRPTSHFQVKGENIIAIFEGKNWKKADDKVLVIGAHYDTAAVAQGLTDNGSGITALLELAKDLSEKLKNGYVLLNTVIFAAFDIQKMEHATTGMAGNPGSHHFVNEFLAPILFPAEGPEPTFRGAIILDSIMNYSPDAGSQVLASGFDRVFPGAYQFIRNNSNTGNFMCAVSKVTPTRFAGIAQDLDRYWSRTPSAKKYPLLDLEILRNLGEQALTEFLKQDHMPFWNFYKKGVPNPLPAILLSDTGIWRNTPRCVSQGCEELLNPDRLEFLDQTVQAVSLLIKDMQLDPSSRGNLSPCITSSIGLLLTSILAVRLL